MLTHVAAWILPCWQALLEYTVEVYLQRLFTLIAEANVGTALSRCGLLRLTLATRRARNHV